MDNRWGVGVPDSAVVMLAVLMLKRIRLHGMKVDNRQDALAVIKGLRPAVSKRTPLSAVVPSAIGKTAREVSRCSSCGKALQTGSLCRTVWTAYDGEHIRCEGKARTL